MIKCSYGEIGHHGSLRNFNSQFKSEYEHQFMHSRLCYNDEEDRDETKGLPVKVWQGASIYENRYEQVINIKWICFDQKGVDQGNKICP